MSDLYILDISLKIAKMLIAFIFWVAGSNYADYQYYLLCFLPRWHTDKKEDGSIPPAIVMPLPSKRGRKKKSMMPRAGLVSAHALATGSDALILAHLAAGGQVRRHNFTFMLISYCLYYTALHHIHWMKSSYCVFFTNCVVLFPNSVLVLLELVTLSHKILCIL